MNATDRNTNNQPQKTKVARLATLSDEPAGLTCSADAAKNEQIAEELIYCNTFEMAAQFVKNEKADALLVPAAYPNINALIMDIDLQPCHTFIRRIPSLVYAATNDPTRESCTERIETIYFHPATLPLMKEIKNLNHSANHIQATSNSDACKRLLTNPNNSACITNKLCADYYNLQIKQILREGIYMPWIVLKRPA